MDCTDKPSCSKQSTLEVSSEEISDEEEVQCITKEVVDVAIESDGESNQGETIVLQGETTQPNQVCCHIEEKKEDDTTVESSSLVNSVVNLFERDIKKEDVEESINTKTKRFTEEEDAFLKKGIEKYGCGNWKRILVDKEFAFHSSRSRDTLRMRAKTLRLTTKSSEGERKKYSVRRRKDEAN